MSDTNGSSKCTLISRKVDATMRCFEMTEGLIVQRIYEICKDIASVHADRDIHEDINKLTITLTAFQRNKRAKRAFVRCTTSEIEEHVTCVLSKIPEPQLSRIVGPILKKRKHDCK